MSERTIAAIATPLGEGSLGVIRISGDAAIDVADRVFFPFSGKKLKSLKGYTAAYGQVKNKQEVIDDAVALVFRAPNSFTGEDTVEISVHGGTLLMREVLRLILDNGAFPAEAGEFSKRAFLNGKTDLTRAESIMGLISARNNAELRLSRAAHLGNTARKIADIEAALTAADAAISVYSDYPEEDIDGLDNESFSKMLKNVSLELEQMLSEYDSGKILREGIETVIVGKPNVGKSTLMNMLSGSQRSIVTDVAGTTRDIIEDTVTIGNITLRLADTAGIHATEDKVESIGVELAKNRLDAAQLILAVFDCTRQPDNDDLELLEAVRNRNTIVVINKTDLNSQIDMSLFDGMRTVEISAMQGNGYDRLCNLIAEISGTQNLSADSVILINERQRACAQRTLDAVTEALDALLGGCTLDAVGVCVDDALAALFELTGKRVTNEVTDEIFRRFCVGK